MSPHRWANQGAVNYEDRTDLLPPDQVVSGSLLAKLRRATEAARLMTLSLDAQSPGLVRRRTR